METGKCSPAGSKFRRKVPDSARWPVCLSLSVQLHALLIFPSSPQLHSLSPSSRPPLWLTLYQELLILLPLAVPNPSGPDSKSPSL
ncbi:rCG37396 [Rattus norvegicus]|uniref:RCG37396 n=1 Tax=Rattus norvegicus TaxID=10116 RepID=A6KI63_RAT|nr:rCG37396 [Rattus norvegicus]